VTEPQVHVTGKIAWVTYTNRGIIDGPKGRSNKVWLESAVLERKDKQWRIRFMHSTLSSEQK
jgi:ketosteroid isomerase-like protein